MNVHVELAASIVKACCILLNFVRMRDGYRFEHTLYIEGLENVNNVTENHGITRSGNTVRDRFANYFISEAGKVDWQDKMIK